VLPHQNEYVSHIALDMGGSLIKLIYFSREEGEHGELQQPQTQSTTQQQQPPNGSGSSGNSAARMAVGGGRLHFVKFETSKVEDCVRFIEQRGLHRGNGAGLKMRVKATGGGAYKYAKVSTRGKGGGPGGRGRNRGRGRLKSSTCSWTTSPQCYALLNMNFHAFTHEHTCTHAHTQLFKERLDMILEREDEMTCMVNGANFLLKAVQHEAFTYENDKIAFQDLNQGMWLGSRSRLGA
jgi:pantothenate kinase